MGTMDGQVHIEFDQDWQAKGLCGAGIPSCDTVTIADYRSNGTISLDFRGYVYWDDDHWEIHPATSWKPSTTAKWAPASVESTSADTAAGGASWNRSNDTRSPDPSAAPGSRASRSAFVVPGG